MSISGGVFEDKAEQIRWWDALDALAERWRGPLDQAAWLHGIRTCRHPDAQWLASLFPPGVDVSRKRMEEVMLEQMKHDSRAGFFAWLFGESVEVASSYESLVRSAERGYAPAQGRLALLVGEDDAESLKWSMRGAGQNDRNAICRLGVALHNGWGCAVDAAKGEELIRLSAEWEHAGGEYVLGLVAYGEHDWERYMWWLRAAERGINERPFCEVHVMQFLLPTFERGENSRILHVVAPVIRKHLDVEKSEVFGCGFTQDKMAMLLRVLELHDQLTGVVRRSVDCFAIVGRRCGLVKDVRVLIGKLLWEEAWRWGQDKKVEEAEQ
jgi:hypothetical protein